MNIVGHHHISMYTKMQNVIRIFTQMSLDYDWLKSRLIKTIFNVSFVLWGRSRYSRNNFKLFEIPNAGHKQPGTETIYRFSLLPNQAALHYFEKRLENNGIKSERLYYLGQEGVVFKDEDDLEIILLVNDSFEVPHQWQHNAYSEIPQAYQILGIGPVELRVRNAARTVEFWKMS